MTSCTVPLTYLLAGIRTSSLTLSYMYGRTYTGTHSLGSGFGSGIVIPGTGVALNNFLNWADVDPASPAAIRGGAKASETDISCVSPMFVWQNSKQNKAEKMIGQSERRCLSHMVMRIFIIETHAFGTWRSRGGHTPHVWSYVCQTCFSCYDKKVVDKLLSF